jgi:WhiB family transcriptional regulator, redox-sensing transcriptional regulator
VNAPRLIRGNRPSNIAPFDGNPNALCRTVDPDLFFIPDGLRGKNRQRRVEQAQAVCWRCPLRPDCAAWALANPGRAEFGVFGGLSEADRKAIKRANAVMPCGTVSAYRRHLAKAEACARCGTEGAVKGARR